MPTQRTQTITLGERSFLIPERLPMGIVREHAKAFIALTAMKNFTVEEALNGVAVDAMVEIIHAGVVLHDPTVTLEEFNRLFNELDYLEGFRAIGAAVTQLMKSRRPPESGIAGESDSSSSATSPVSTG